MGCRDTGQKEGSLCDPPVSQSWLHCVGRGVTRLTLRLLFGAEHHDTHHIPREGPAILVSNHPTISDPFVVAFGTRRWVTWLAYEDALAWPVAGDLMRLYCAIPLNLERPRPSSIKASPSARLPEETSTHPSTSFAWLDQKGSSCSAVNRSISVVRAFAAAG